MIAAAATAAAAVVAVVIAVVVAVEVVVALVRCREKVEDCCHCRHYFCRHCCCS